MTPRRQGSGPQFIRFLAPILQALQERGGSAQPNEILSRVADIVSLTPAAAAETTSNGQLRFDNQVHWARFYLARAGFIDASTRGVWTLTQRGADARPGELDAKAVFQEVRQSLRGAGATRDEDSNDELEAAPSPVPSTDHRVRAHALLMSLSASGFERFSQRLLREAGFQDVRVTGKSGDGGIDGIGLLQVNALVSFKVLFQCKRYANSVSPSQVRDFRGAMMGRADKGIIITTGSFTSDAKREAVRDGVPPIELVDSDRLIDMLEQLELGLRPAKAFVVDDVFFQAFDR